MQTFSFFFNGIVLFLVTILMGHFFYNASQLVFFWLTLLAAIFSGLCTTAGIYCFESVRWSTELLALMLVIFPLFNFGIAMLSAIAIERYRQWKNSPVRILKKWVRK